MRVSDVCYTKAAPAGKGRIEFLEPAFECMRVVLLDAVRLAHGHIPACVRVGCVSASRAQNNSRDQGGDFLTLVMTHPFLHLSHSSL